MLIPMHHSVDCRSRHNPVHLADAVGLPRHAHHAISCEALDNTPNRLPGLVILEHPRHDRLFLLLLAEAWPSEHHTFCLPLVAQFLAVCSASTLVETLSISSLLRRQLVKIGELYHGPLVLMYTSCNQLQIPIN